MFATESFTSSKNALIPTIVITPPSPELPGEERFSSSTPSKSFAELEAGLDIISGSHAGYSETESLDIGVKTAKAYVLYQKVGQSKVHIIM